MIKVDRNLIRKYFDELQIATRLDDDGDLQLIQEADNDFGYDVYIFVTILDGRLAYAAAAPDFKPEGDFLEMVNNHNLNNCIPTAVVSQGELRMSYTFVLDEDVSEAYIKNNCIIFPLSAIWNSFVKFGQGEY